MKLILTKPPDLVHLDKAEQQVLEKALAKSPKERYANCKEFTGALERAIFPPPSVPSKWWVRTLLVLVLLLLTVLGFAAWRWRPDLPEGFEPAAAATAVFSEPNNRYFYDQIVKQLPDGQQVEFVLICSDDPPTFYIMKHKVWNSLFAQFAQADSDQLAQDTQWQRGASVKVRGDLPAQDHPQNPVFRVTWDEASRCARWLGGRLPAAQEWDKAAGFQDHAAELAGPYLEHGELSAIGLSPHGPLPTTRVETADVSPLGVCDMAGNGLEWTGDQVPLRGEPEASFFLRGMDYRKPKPLDYEYSYWDSRSQPRSVASPSIGFRVVVDALDDESHADP
jgi:hypothetical protein